MSSQNQIRSGIASAPPRHPQLSWPSGLTENCSLCPRLVEFRSTRWKARGARIGYDYWGRPVPDIGDPGAWLLVVGMAPGAHGAARTGIAFTGDIAGVVLYRGLYEAGLSSGPNPEASDPQIRLSGVMITNIARCVPEGDKLKTNEIENCRPFLHGTIDALAPTLTDILCIGQVAFKQVKAYLRLNGIKGTPKFKFGEFFEIGNYRIWMSYHTSRRNLNSGRITQEAFTNLVNKVVRTKNRSSR